MRNGSFTYRKIIGYRNLDKLKVKLLDPEYASRLTKEEVLHDLPDKLTGTRIFVDMEPQQAKMYKEMKKEMATVFKDQEIEITSAITKHTKLMQIANGVIHTETDKKELCKVNPKTKALFELIDDLLPKKVVVFSMLKSTVLIEALERDLKERYGQESTVVFSGATSQEDRGKYVDQFQDTSSPVKIFIGNSAASRGLTLTAADVNVFYSNDYSFETREQAESRSHRMGQKNVVTIIDIISRGTDEDKVLNALETKKKLSDFLMDIKKEYL
jgi:SNF2 family DNA or RNA helicase